MTNPLTVEEAADVLAEHREDIRDILQNGWSRWRKLVESDTELAVIVSGRTRASLVYDFIRYEAMNHFDGLSDVVISEGRGILLLTFHERLLLRFKKFRSKALKTSGIPTQQARDFATQTLPGMEELTHIVAGYLPDEAGIDLDRVAITCSIANEMQWVIDLDFGLEEVVGLDDGLGPVGPTTVAPLVPTDGQGDTQVVAKVDRAEDGRE
ncbi:hypothetical protein AB0436_08760 [Streptomyces sp. NPDC051322]|uniref:hypothetical protein n=1 Tax=Streptomyces sp. NPDC051322 TaxID=3154645 RepID=UPI00344F6C00